MIQSRFHRTLDLLQSVARRRSALAASVSFLASVLVGACDLGSGPGPSPASIAVLAGNGQTATVGTPVSLAPSVRVLNRKGRPLARQEVVFTVSSGEGHVTGGTQRTDKEGVATVGGWVLGTTSGSNELQALVEGLAPVTFSATGTAGPAATMIIKDGDDQTGTVGAALPVSPSVIVQDLYENRVPGENVTFEVVAGGGEVAEGTTTTDVTGVATAGSWILGTVPGSNVLTASVAGLSPLGFTAVGEADVPATITVFRGEEQVGTVGTPLPLRPAVTVRDQYGNLLRGVPVIFTVTGGEGIIEDGQTITDAFGIAEAGIWSLGTVAGPQTLTVTVPGVDPITLSATAEADEPASSQAHAGVEQTGTVGTPVPTLPAVRIQDKYGNPVPGVAVFFEETSSPATAPSDEGGEGPSFAEPATISGAEATTDSDGVATIGGWTLGTVAGTYELTANPAGLDSPVTFSAEAQPDLPAGLVKADGDGQSAKVGEKVPVSPSVKVEDQFGNGVPGLEVEFTVTGGGGTVEGGITTTGANGVATVVSWTLGTSPGTNLLRAAVPGLDPTTFQATALSAIPAALLKRAGDGQSATVRSVVPVPPEVEVVDEGGEPVASILVTFEVVSGGGSVTNSSVLTGSDGRAAAGRWTLGTVAGTNTLRARVDGLDPVVFSATGLAGPVSDMMSYAGDGQSATVSTAVAIPPSVRLVDSFGNPVPGAAVTFTVTQGGGTVVGSPTQSDAAGRAGVTSWILGAAPGENTLTASRAGLADVVFTASATATAPVGEFSVDLQFMTAMEPSQESIFGQAASRWEEVIVGDIPDFGGVLSAGGCQPVDENFGIDDVKIYVSVLAIDGEGGILGQAGPCAYRTPGSPFPITGIMRLDEADLDAMEASGMLRDVIVHEMGHVLGFGTLWNAGSTEFLVGGETSDPYFNGAGAVAAFDAAGGAARTDPKVPVENTGGAGTRNAHWRESVHGAELMTGWIEPPGTSNPLSAITIASFADVGYTVDMGAADPYTLEDPLAAFRLDTASKVFLEELPPPQPMPAGGSSR